MDNPPPQFSQYPRPGFPGGGYPTPYWRPPGVYFEAIGDAWKLVSEDLGIWVGSAALVLGLIVLQTVISQLIMNGGTLLPRPRAFDWSAFATSEAVALTFAVFTNILQAGMMWMAVKKARGGELTFSDAFAGFRRFGTVLGSGILVGLLYIVGALCCLVPAFYILGALCLTPVVAIDQPVDSLEVIRRCYAAMKSNAWMMFLLVFVAGIVASLGFCACGVGALFSMPLYCATIGLHYFYNFPPVDPNAGFGYIPRTPDI